MLLHPVPPFKAFRLKAAFINGGVKNNNISYETKRRTKVRFFEFGM